MMLSRPQVRQLVTEGLPVILGQLKAPAATDYIVAELCDMNALPKKGPEAKAIAEEVIRRVTSHGAMKSSVTFQRFGRVCHRWIWPPSSETTSVIDWTVPPKPSSAALRDWLDTHPGDPRAMTVLSVLQEAGAV